ncbi:MAG: DUF3365 domain-containing protein [Bacteroidetes bacterium]|nr:DUF3365 domain-containing protein [Bacteroidota bacterium]
MTHEHSIDHNARIRRVCVNGHGLPILFLLLLMTGCGGGDQTTDMTAEREAAEAQARRATERLVGTLMGEVQQSIRADGLAGAVSHCATRAQELSHIVGEEEGVKIRRVTGKTRNPLDAPDNYEKIILSRFEAMTASGELNPTTVHSEVMETDGRRVLRFLKPIVIRKNCLGCHGGADDIPEDVKAQLREYYPSDQATGYREGELRGAVSVLVPLQSDE